MTTVTEVDIALGILDHQLVDGDGQNCGKVDDLEITDLDSDSPHVVEIVVGGTPGALAVALDVSRRACQETPSTCPGRRSTLFHQSSL